MSKKTISQIMAFVLVVGMLAGFAPAAPIVSAEASDSDVVLNFELTGKMSQIITAATLADGNWQYSREKSVKYFKNDDTIANGMHKIMDATGTGEVGLKVNLLPWYGALALEFNVEKAGWYQLSGLVKGYHDYSGSTKVSVDNGDKTVYLGTIDAYVESGVQELKLPEFEKVYLNEGSNYLMLEGASYSPVSSSEINLIYLKSLTFTPTEPDVVLNFELAGKLNQLITSVTLEDGNWQYSAAKSHTYINDRIGNGQYKIIDATGTGEAGIKLDMQPWVGELALEFKAETAGWYEMSGIMKGYHSYSGSTSFSVDNGKETVYLGTVDAFIDEDCAVLELPQFEKVYLNEGSNYLLIKGASYSTVWQDQINLIYLKKITFKPATAPALTGVSLDKSALNVMVGESAELNASLAPAGVETEIVWESSDDKVATVVDGVVTGQSIGQAVITAKAGDFSATCNVEVTAFEIKLNFELADKIGQLITSVTMSDGNWAYNAAKSHNYINDRIENGQYRIVDATGTGEAGLKLDMQPWVGALALEFNAPRAGWYEMSGVMKGFHDYSGSTSFSVYNGEKTYYLGIVDAFIDESCAELDLPKFEKVYLNEGINYLLIKGASYSTIWQDQINLIYIKNITFIPTEPDVVLNFELADKIGQLITSVTMSDGNWAYNADNTDSYMAERIENGQYRIIDATGTGEAGLKVDLQPWVGTLALEFKAEKAGWYEMRGIIKGYYDYSGSTFVSVYNGEKIVYLGTIDAFTDENAKVIELPEFNKVYLNEGSNYLLLKGESYSPIYNEQINLLYLKKVTFTPTEAPVLTGIALDRSELVMLVGEEDILAATVSEAGAVAEIVWKSSDEGVVTVVDGHVKAVGAGKAEITVTVGAFSATCNVTVEAPAPEYDTGDINGDGRVNTRDVTNLRRYLAGGYEDSITVIESMVDVNGDGRENTRDVATLRAIIAG